MKKLELRQLIKEEIQKILKDNYDYAPVIVHKQPITSYPSKTEYIQ